MVPLCNHQNRVIYTSLGRTYVLRPTSHHDDVMRTLNEQRRRGDKNLCDVTLAVEGSLMLAHKAVLASCSNYFKDRFEEKKLRFSKDLSDHKGEESAQKQVSNSKAATMSPPDSSLVKRRRNALSECIPEASSSPVPPQTTRTPPPQVLQSRLRPTFLRAFPHVSGEVVVLPGLKSKAFSLILDYMYTSELQINKENVEDLLFVACLLQIKTIVDACVRILTKENKWKISTSSFSINKMPPVASSQTLPGLQSRLNTNRRNQLPETLLASPLTNTSSSQTRSIVQDNSCENRSFSEKSNSKKESSNQRQGQEETKAYVVPAQSRSRDCINDITQVENQDYSDTREMAETGQAITTASFAAAAQINSQSSSQQLSTSPKVDLVNSKVGLANEEARLYQTQALRSEPQFSSRESDVKFYRSRSLSCGLRSSLDKSGALDLRRKPKMKQNLSDDETKVAFRKSPLNQKSENHKQRFNLNREVRKSPEIRSSPSGITKPSVDRNKANQETSSSPQSCTEISGLLKEHALAPQQHGSSPLDQLGPSLVYPSIQAFASSLGSLYPYKDMAFGCPHSAVTNDTLKQIGLLATIPTNFPNYLWSGAAKLLSSEQLSLLRERPIPTIEALQIHPWPNYLDQYSALKPEVPQSCTFPVPVTSRNNSLKSQTVTLYPQDGASQINARLSPTEQTRQSSLQDQTSASFEPSKHPLKRKLMLSATTGGAENFRALSIDGEPPIKSSPKPVSPSVNSIETLRGPESLGSSTLTQPCVM